MEQLTESPTAIGAESAGAVIEVEALRKHYGPIKAVDGLSFSVRRGDVLGFLGPNGAGKTTAMRMITGFLEPDSGSVRVAGHDMASDSLAARRKIGYLPENAPAYGEMTVTSFLHFIAEARQVPDPLAAVGRVVETTGLQRVQHQTIDTLSKGFKRRVGLAQALIHDPEVLILDEPTDGLDPNQKDMVRQLIASLAGSKCIILSTHVLDEVEKVCNRAMIISGGRIVADSTPAELVARVSGHNSIELQIKGGFDSADRLADQIEVEPWCRSVRVEAVADEMPGTSSDGPAKVIVEPADDRDIMPDLLGLDYGGRLLSIERRIGRLDELFRDLTGGADR